MYKLSRFQIQARTLFTKAFKKSSQQLTAKLTERQINDLHRRCLTVKESYEKLCMDFQTQNRLLQKSFSKGVPSPRKKTLQLRKNTLFKSDFPYNLRELSQSKEFSSLKIINCQLRLLLFAIRCINSVGDKWNFYASRINWQKLEA